MHCFLTNPYVLTIRLRNVQNRNCVQAKPQLWLRVYRRVLQRVLMNKTPLLKNESSSLQICPQLLASAWPGNTFPGITTEAKWLCFAHTFRDSQGHLLK